MSLIAVLMVLFIVSAALTLLGYLMLRSERMGHRVSQFKTTKQAAESIAVAVMDSIEGGYLDLVCTDNVTSWCPLTFEGGKNGTCFVVLPPELEKALAESGLSGRAVLLAICTQNSTANYAIRVNATAADGSKTNIYFIYQAPYVAPTYTAAP